MHYQPDRGFQHPVASDITPRAVYEARRDCLRAVALGAAGTALGAWAGRDALASTAAPGKLAPLPGGRSSVSGATTMEKPTPYKDASTYNNFYEFGTDKSDPARNAGTLRPTPWSVTIGGEAQLRGTFALDDLLKPHPLEERIFSFFSSPSDWRRRVSTPS